MSHRHTTSSPPLVLDPLPVSGAETQASVVTATMVAAPAPAVRDKTEAEAEAGLFSPWAYGSQWRSPGLLSAGGVTLARRGAEPLSRSPSRSSTPVLDPAAALARIQPRSCSYQDLPEPRSPVGWDGISVGSPAPISQKIRRRRSKSFCSLRDLPRAETVHGRVPNIVLSFQASRASAPFGKRVLLEAPTVAAPTDLAVAATAVAAKASESESATVATKRHATRASLFPSSPNSSMGCGLLCRQRSNIIPPQPLDMMIQVAESDPSSKGLDTCVKPMGCGSCGQNDRTNGGKRLGSEVESESDEVKERQGAKGAKALWEMRKAMEVEESEEMRKVADVEGSGEMKNAADVEESEGQGPWTPGECVVAGHVVALVLLWFLRTG